MFIKKTQNSAGVWWVLKMEVLTDPLRTGGTGQGFFFLEGLPFQGLFSETGWNSGGGGFSLLLLMLMGTGICLGVTDRFRMRRKMAGAAGRNHPAIPAIFYDTPKLPDSPEAEVPSHGEPPEELDFLEWEEDPEDFTSYFYLDQIP